MMHLEFSEEDVQQLKFERFYHPHPRVQKKMEALLLKSQELPHQRICEIVGICGNTLRSYFREFQEGGVERLKRFEAGGSSSELDEHSETIRELLTKHPPQTIAEAVELIAEHTGVRRSETQIRALLKRLGFRRLKVGSVPAQGDAEEQERLKKTNWSPA